MSDTKHTPGPWVAMNGATTIYGPLGGDSGDGWAADDTDGWMVAEVGNYPTLCEGEMTELGEECRLANAHLIAAAPDLLAALEEIMRWWDGDDGIEEQFINARQALEKAKGE